MKLAPPPQKKGEFLSQWNLALLESLFLLRRKLVFCLSVVPTLSCQLKERKEVQELHTAQMAFFTRLHIRKWNIMAIAY